VTRAPTDAAGFLDWAQGLPDGARAELWRGALSPRKPAPPRAARALTDATLAFRAALRRAALSGGVYPEGLAVVVDRDTVLWPDLTIGYGGGIVAGIGGWGATAETPVIVVEARGEGRSPLPDAIRAHAFLRAPGVAHHLLLDAQNARVIAHTREADGAIMARALDAGALRLDPPGLSLMVADLFLTG